MARVYVSIGSNIEREHNIPGAVASLCDRFGKLAISPVFQSRPIGFTGNDFFNLVAGFDTSLDPRALDGELTAIECAFGRRSDAVRYAPRALDIDLLLYGDLVIHDDGLELPRADILKYAFVLRPLCDIAPEVRHPVAGRSIAELWADFDGEDQTLSPVWLPNVPSGAILTSKDETQR
jgi:2-amino-4-hydroxy-6-hydroxymethyldihydropteridine diphosphokinase